MILMQNKLVRSSLSSGVGLGGVLHDQGLIIVHTTSIVCTIVVTNLIVNILLLYVET